MAKILITGASGYIGSFLSKWLLAAGHEVTATARRRTAPLVEVLEGCEVRELDVLDVPSDFSGQWDCLVHAATANDILSRDFEAGVGLSTYGTRNMAEFARRAGIPHLVFFSTLQVYGAELEGRVDEDTPAAPVNDYGLNHLFGEMVCRLACVRGSLNATVLRPANVYGAPVSPTVNRSTLVPMCFVEEVLATGGITLRSSGLQERDFVSLRQVAEACNRVIATGGKGFSVRNIATGKTFPILEAARWTSEAFVAAGFPEPEIRVLDENPIVGNTFEVGSSITPESLQGGTRHEMQEEIAKIIKIFKQNHENTHK